MQKIFNKFSSIQLKLWLAFAVVILVTNILMACAFMLITNKIETDNVTNKLDVALKTAWNQLYVRALELKGIQYEAIHSQELLQAVSSRNYSQINERIKRWQFSYPFVDFWLITDSNGFVIGRSGPSVLKEKWELSDLIELCVDKKDTVITTAMMSNTALKRENPGLALRAEIPIVSAENHAVSPMMKNTMTDGLINVVATPILNDNEEIIGCMVGGFLLNNDNWLPREYTNKIPDTYLSIGVEGVRITSNIETNVLSRPAGSIQEEALIKTISMNERYRGSLYVNGKFSLLAVDPIINYRGEVIGNIGVGAPVDMFTILKGPTFIIIMLCFIVFVIAMIFAEVIGNNILRPILQLRDLANGVANRYVEPEDMSWDDVKAPTEVTNLAETIITMAKSLQQKENEVKLYAQKLLDEKEMLETKVEQRTCELAETVSQLQRTNQYKSQFLANMSHELRTPLNAIIGFSDLLKDQVAGTLNSKQIWYAENILSTGYQLLELINDILDLVRIEQGKDKVNFEYAEISEIVNSLLTLFEKEAEEKDITITCNIKENLPSIFWDRNKVKQVLINLVSNAVKFTPSGGEITISAEKQEKNILFRVKDNGIGIKPEDHERVFLAFEQAESSYTRQFQGVGLGLSISKKLVELHHGKIWIESQPGMGTTVFVLVPVRPLILGDGNQYAASLQDTCS